MAQSAKEVAEELPSVAAVVEMPAGHAEQPEAARVPGLVTAPKNPGAQTVQAATDELPAAAPAVDTPLGQAVHAIDPAAA